MAEFKVGDRVRHTPSGMVGVVTHITQKGVEPDGQHPGATIIGYVVRLDDGSEATVYQDLEAVDDDKAPGE
jgi:preprotein translocase subunit YajC